MKKQSTRALQRGWTTMEYVVGAIIIISIVTSVIALVQNGLETKGKKIQQELSN